MTSLNILESELERRIFIFLTVPALVLFFTLLWLSIDWIGLAGKDNSRLEPVQTDFSVWLMKIREEQNSIHDEKNIRRVRSKSWTIDSWSHSRSRSKNRDSRPITMIRPRSQSRSRQTSLNSQV